MSDQQSTIDTPSAEAPVIEDPVSETEVSETEEADVAAAETTVVEATATETSTAEVEEVETAAAEVAAAEAPAAEEAVADLPVEDTVVEDTVVEDTVVEDTVVEDTVVEDTVVDEAAEEEAVAEVESDPTRFELPVQADIRMAAEIHHQCEAALEAGGDVRIDCSGVERVDAAVLQCIGSLANSLQEGARQLELADRSRSFDQAAAVLGFDEFLLGRASEAVG